MKQLFLASIALLFFACSNNKNTPKKLEVAEFQTILDTANVQGSILIYHLEDDTYYSNDFEWANKGQLPASTFKIANSIIALETGVVENDSTLFKWNGEKRSLKTWEQDLILRDAFHYSCVPCYQEVARKIGAKRMVSQLEKLDYGAMKVDSSNIDRFWLEGDSRINQFQQIDFLRRFYQSKLPISNRTENIMKRMMVLEDNGDYKISGKTGWSSQNGKDNGWFVGYLKTGKSTYFFATNIEPKGKFDMSRFAEIRKEVTYRAFNRFLLFLE